MEMLVFETGDFEKKFFNNEVLNDYNITLFSQPLNERTELTDEQMENTAILSVFIHSHITENLLSKFKNLRIIATRSTGYNHIDIEACKKRHIAVVNVEDYGRTSVAQYTIGVMIALVRNIVPAVIDMRSQMIYTEHYEGRDLSNMVLGVIGTGAVGTTVCTVANALGMKVIACDSIRQENLKQLAEYMDFKEVISNADILSLHVPYTPETYHLLGENEFRMMKNEVYIINTARGELIDINALYKAVFDKKVKGAALDVLECEFINFFSEDLSERLQETDKKCLSDTVLAWKLAEMPNIIITPHIAYDTVDAVNTILSVSLNSIKDYFKGHCKNRVC